MVKKAHDIAEHARNAVRQARREGNDKLKKLAEGQASRPGRRAPRPRRGPEAPRPLHRRQSPRRWSTRKRTSSRSEPGRRRAADEPLRRSAASSIALLVPAAGRGERFGGELPKQFSTSPAGRCWPGRSNGCSRAGVDQVVVALPDDRLAARAWRLPTARACGWIAGGATRQESVARCAGREPGRRRRSGRGARRRAAGGGDSRDIAAHASAPPRRADGAVLGRPLADTLKRLEGERIDTHASTATASSAPRRRRSSAAQLLERALALAPARPLRGHRRSLAGRAAARGAHRRGGRRSAPTPRSPSPRIVG